MALMAGGMASWEWTDQKSVWEDSLFELLGIKPVDNPSTELFFQFVHPEDLPSLKTTWDRAASGQVRYQTEFRIVRQDGTVHWLAGVGEVIRNSDGVVVGMHGLNWDVTDRVEAEQRIRSSEERLRLALEAAELNLWQWDVTTDKVYWSGTQTHTSGLVPVAPIGRLEKFLEFVHPTDRQRVREALNECLRSDAPYRCEYRIRCSPSSYRWVMAMGHLSVQDRAAPAQLIGIELDITERRANEEAIRLSELRLRMAAEAGGFGMLHVNVRKGQVKYSTEVRRMLGYPEGTELQHHHEESTSVSSSRGCRGLSPLHQGSLEEYFGQRIAVP